MIRCSCENCGSARCSCVSSAVRCTVFCRCHGSNECLNSRRGLMLLSRIQIAIRKMTNKGIALSCQHINDSLCDCYITKSTMSICLKMLIGQIGLLYVQLSEYSDPFKKEKIASFATTIICLFDTTYWWRLKPLSKYLLNIMGYFKIIFSVNVFFKLNLYFCN